MDDLPLEKIQISGPTVASILQRFSSSSGDVDGLLFGHVAHVNPSSFSDDDPSAAAAAAAAAASTSSSSDSPTYVATITSFFCSNSNSIFYDSTGNLDLESLRRLLSEHRHSSSLIGWFSGRRRSPLRPSLRESSVTCSLSSKVQLSFSVGNSPQPCSISPSIFLLLTSPFQENLIHTQEYKAYQFRLPSKSFEPKTLDVVNIGPAFRGHYGSFCPNSPFPSLACEFKGGLSSMAEDGRVEKDQKELDDLCAKGFDVARLSGLIGTQATNYTSELEELYKTMLVKLDDLARLVEKTSSRVSEQENHNMKFRFKIAGLE